MNMKTPATVSIIQNWIYVSFTRITATTATAAAVGR